MEPLDTRKAGALDVAGARDVPRNLLIAQKTQEVVAVDWSYSGISALGSEFLYVLFVVSPRAARADAFQMPPPARAPLGSGASLIEATPRSRQPTHLIHDRDAVFGGAFGSRLARLGIVSMRTPVKSPKANTDLIAALASRARCRRQKPALEEASAHVRFSAACTTSTLEPPELDRLLPPCRWHTGVVPTVHSRTRRSASCARRAFEPRA